MPRWVTVDFWDVLNANGQPVNLVPLLQGVGELDPANRMRPRGLAHTDFLAEVAAQPDWAEGMAARIRNQDWPERVNLTSGLLRPLNLPADEAIAEEMNFRFDRGLQVLATQRQPFFRGSALIDLLSELSTQGLEIQPKLREDAWRRFQRMTRIGGIELKLQSPAHHPDLSPAIPSMARFLDDAAERLSALEVQIFLTTGRARSKSLDRPLIRRILSAFRHQNNVTGLVVKGSRADEPAEIIDFIRDRLLFSGEVEYAGKHLDREQCRRLLREAIETHRPYLVSLL